MVADIKMMHGHHTISDLNVAEVTVHYLFVL